MFSLSKYISLLCKQLKSLSYPLCTIEQPVNFSSSLIFNSVVLNVFLIEFPNILFTSLFLSNLVIAVSFIVNVDWLAVNLLISSALLDILFPKPQLVIILVPSIKYSKESGPDW